MTIRCADDKSNTLRRYEELLTEAAVALYNAQRAKAHWERRIADLKSDDLPSDRDRYDFQGEMPVLKGAVI